MLELSKAEFMRHQGGISWVWIGKRAVPHELHGTRRCVMVMINRRVPRREKGARYSLEGERRSALDGEMSDGWRKRKGIRMERERGEVSVGFEGGREEMCLIPLF